MKKFLALMLALCMVFALCACGQSAAPAEDASEAPAAEAEAPAVEEAAAPVIKVGIASPDNTHGWVAGVAYFAEKYCKDNGYEYKVTTASDAAEMAANLSDLVAWGATLVVSFPQWAGMETAMQEVIDAGIPVVNFDVDVDCQGIYKVTGDNYDMGYQSAKFIIEKAGDAATIAVLDVPSSGSVAELRKQGFYDYLTEVGYDQSNIFEIVTAFTRDDGLKDVADLLENYDHIDALFSLDDETSIGAIQAITEAGRTDIKAITGGGGCQEYFNMIADEQYAGLGLASALYSPMMIQDAIDTGIAILNGETPEAVIVIPTTIVSAENVADFLDPENDVY